MELAAMISALLYVITASLGSGNALKVLLEAPRYVMKGGSVSLHCQYDAEEDNIHKVEWSRSGQKILQFIRTRSIQFKNFTVKGAEINWQETSETTLTLKNMRFEASGLYACEVTTESPIYSKPSEEIHITVVQSQSDDPDIIFNKVNYTVGDILDANCTSSPAIPIPVLTWLLNGRKVKESFMISHPELQQAAAMVQLKLPVTKAYYPQMHLSCVSSTPAFLGHHIFENEYADYRVKTIIVDVMLFESTKSDQTVSNAWHTKMNVFICIPITLMINSIQNVSANVLINNNVNV